MCYQSYSFQNKRVSLASKVLAVCAVLVAVAGQARGVSFVTRQEFNVGVNPASVAVGDFNGDGRLDLAVANEGTFPLYADGSVSVLLGNGDGSFQEPRNVGAGTVPRSVAVGDFNGDGVLDLAVANQSSADVSVLLGNDDGS